MLWDGIGELRARFKDKWCRFDVWWYGWIVVFNRLGNVEFYAMSVAVFVGPLVVMYVCGIVFWLIELWTIMCVCGLNRTDC